jgi:hypothetical protein
VRSRKAADHDHIIDAGIDALHFSEQHAGIALVAKDGDSTLRISALIRLPRC